MRILYRSCPPWRAQGLLCSRGVGSALRSAAQLILLGGPRRAPPTPRPLRRESPQAAPARAREPHLCGARSPRDGGRAGRRRGAQRWEHRECADRRLRACSPHLSILHRTESHVTLTHAQAELTTARRMLLPTSGHRGANSGRQHLVNAVRVLPSPLPTLSELQRRPLARPRGSSYASSAAIASRLDACTPSRVLRLVRGARRLRFDMWPRRHTTPERSPVRVVPGPAPESCASYRNTLGSLRDSALT